MGCNQLPVRLIKILVVNAYILIGKHNSTIDGKETFFVVNAYILIGKHNIRQWVFKKFRSCKCLYFDR